MGRGKIEIKKIENTTNRQVTFSKRRAGLFKKANELSILCAADVAVILYSSTGKAFEFSSSSMKRTLERYRSVSATPVRDIEQQNMAYQLKRARKENEKLKAELRSVMGEDLESLQIKDLGCMEEALEIAGKIVRKKKMERLKYEYNNRKRKVEWTESVMRLQYPHFTQMANYYGQTFDEPEGSSAAAAHVTPPHEFRVKPNQPNLQSTGY